MRHRGYLLNHGRSLSCAINHHDISRGKDFKREAKCFVIRFLLTGAMLVVARIGMFCKCLKLVTTGNRYTNTQY
jgi:hypothetical protein